MCFKILSARRSSMVGYWKAALSLQLLLLTSTQGAVKNGVTNVPLRNGDTANISSVKEVSHAMQCFGNITQESLRYHKQTSEALADLHGLPHAVEILTRGMEDIKRQLENKDKVDELTQANEFMKIQLSIRDKEVQDFKRKLEESEELVQKLTGKLNGINSKVESVNITTGETSSSSDQEKVKELVQQYKRSGDWAALKRGLEAQLPYDGVENKQLQATDASDDHLFYNLGMQGHAELVRMLVGAGLSPDAADGDGDGLLHGAAGRGDDSLVHFLVAAGARLEARGWRRRTPLMVAAAGGGLEAVQVLARAGADAAARDDRDRTATVWAEKQGHSEVARWLAQFRV